MKREYYPLTFSQMLMYYNMTYSREKSIVNICATIHFDCEMDKDLLLQAGTLALMRNKSSSIRLHKDGKDIKQYFSEQPPEAIEVLDFSDKTEGELEKCIDRLSKTPAENKSIDVQLYKVKLFVKPDGMYAMYFCVSHIAFDAYSLMQMASDIVALYAALRDGKALPVNKNNPLPAFKQDWEYIQSKQYQDDEKFWTDVFADEPLYSTVNGTKSKEWVDGKRYGKAMNIFCSKGKHINFTLKKEIVEAVRDYAIGIKVSPQCVYLLAVRSYLAMKSGNTDDVTMVNTIARRATKVQKNAGGTRVLGTYFRMNFPNTLTFREACDVMQTKQYQYYAHSNMSTTQIIRIMKESHGTPQTCNYASGNLTYQPYMVANNETVPVHLTTHSNGAAIMPFYLTIMALDNSGNLNCCYEYNTSFVDDEKMEKLHNYLVKFLTTAVKKPDMTLEELMKL